MSAKDSLPATFAFKTREGATGILQILQISDTPPKGVRIRYKILTGNDHKDTAASERANANARGGAGADTAKPRAARAGTVRLVKHQAPQIAVPTSVRNLTEFLEAVAEEAGTTAVGAPLADEWLELAPPAVQTTRAAPFDLLARALNGQKAYVYYNEDRFWVIERTRQNRGNYFAGSDGVLLWTDSAHRDNGRIYIRPVILIDRSGDIVSFWQYPRCIRLVDDSGRSRQTAEPKEEKWSDSFLERVEITSDAEGVERIAECRLLIRLAVCTKWTEFKLKGLDHMAPVTLEQDGAALRVYPASTTTRGGVELIETPLDLTRPFSPLDYQGGSMRTDIELLGERAGRLDGGTGATPFGWHRTAYRPRGGFRKSDLPAVTLVVRTPVELEIHEVEFVFRDLPALSD